MPDLRNFYEANKPHLFLSILPDLASMPWSVHIHGASKNMDFNNFSSQIFTEDLEGSLYKLRNMLRNVIDYASNKESKEMFEEKHFMEMLNKRVASLELHKHSYMKM